MSTASYIPAIERLGLRRARLALPDKHGYGVMAAERGARLHWDIIDCAPSSDLEEDVAAHLVQHTEEVGLGVFAPKREDACTASASSRLYGLPIFIHLNNSNNTGFGSASCSWEGSSEFASRFQGE